MTRALNRRALTSSLVALAVAVVIADTAAATGGIDLPINTMLANIVDVFAGRTAVLIGTIALGAGAFVWMFLRHEKGADSAFRALIGIGIAIGAASIVTLIVGEGALL